MKLFKQSFLPALLIMAVGFTSCVDDDDNNGPSNTPQGNMTGNLTIIEGGVPVESQWLSNNVTCFHDTLLDVFTIRTTDDSGDRITLVLSNGNQGNFQFQSFGENISIYEKANSTDTISTQPNDFLDPPQTGGLVTITTEEYETAEEISGEIVQLSWARIGPGQDDDESFGFIQNAAFNEVPVTKGTDVSIGGDVSLACTIDGTPFNAEFLSAATINNSLVVSASNTSGESVTVNLPAGSAVGTHELGLGSEYTVIYSNSIETYLSTSGSIELTAVNITNGTATGSFNFTGTDFTSTNTVEVTNGTFNAE